MATIASTIALRDNMSAVLNRQTTAANSLTRSLRTVDAVSESFDTSAQWAVANGQLGEMTEYLGRMVTLMQENNSQLVVMSDNFGQVRQQAEETTSKAGGLTSMLKRAAVAVGGLATIKKVIDLSDTLTSTTARLSMMKAESENVAEVSDKIFRSAQRARGEYQSTADAVAKLGTMAGDAFNGTDEIIGFVEQLNKQFTIAGTESTGVQAAMLQLTQAMGSGVLRGEEFNSILEQAPNIIQTIADYMGVPKGQLKEMAGEGKITADIVKNAMFAAAEETNRKFENMPKTMAQTWTSFKNKALKAFEPVLAKINELVNNPDFQTAVDNVANSLVYVAEVALWVLETLSAASAFVYENWEVLSPIFIAAAVALGVYCVALGVHKIKVAAATWAQNGFNISLAAFKALSIAAVIMGIVAAVALLTNGINSAYGTAFSFAGMLGGILMTVLAGLGNIVISIYNIVVEVILSIWNGIANFVNFFANVWSDPLGAIARLFTGFGDSILSVVQTIASAIDGIFGTNLAAGVGNFRNTLNTLVEKTFGKEKYNFKVDEKMWSAKTMDYTEAMNTGYYMGEQFAQGKNPFSTDTSAVDGTGTDVPAGTEDDPVHTSVDNDVNIAEEDLQLMRDVAEARYVQNFVTLTPTVQVSGNTINEKVDVDYVVSEIENRITNEIAASAEGVYG